VANIRSAEKRNRQNAKRQLRNKQIKSRVRTETRKLLEIIESRDKESAQQQFKNVSGLLDSASLKGVLHRNSADRKKSHLQKRINRIEEAQ
jgi:small subunit ribosomal protein S20